MRDGRSESGPSPLRKPSMSSTALRLSTFATAIFDAVTHLAGYDVFIERDGPSCGLLDFQREDHGEAGSMYWGLGLHVVVSHLRVRPQVI